MRALRLLIIGLVQDVFFRAEAKKKADELRLTGWVRNTEDGALEIHAEGSEEKLKEFEQWCWQGPRAANVKDIQKNLVSETNYSSFEIHQ